MFYSLSNAELVRTKNAIFLENALPNLQKNGFEKAPFLRTNFGYHSKSLYIYETCRLIKPNFFEFVNTIITLDKYIQIRINIFQLSPMPNDI